MHRIILTISLLAFCAGCVSRTPSPRAIVANEEHGVLRTLTPQQLRAIDRMVSQGVPVTKKENMDVWADDEIWYRVFVSDGEGCYRLRYEFHPSFRKIKVYPVGYSKFHRYPIIDSVEPAFQPFDEDHYTELMDMFGPGESWSGFLGLGEIAPSGTANGSQPIPSSTNQESSAAGSRR